MSDFKRELDRRIAELEEFFCSRCGAETHDGDCDPMVAAEFQLAIKLGASKLAEHIDDLALRGILKKGDRA